MEAEQRFRQPDYKSEEEAPVGPTEEELAAAAAVSTGSICMLKLDWSLTVSLFVHCIALQAERLAEEARQGAIMAEVEAQNEADRRAEVCTTLPTQA